ncbi:hypothetical protein [Pasteurella multocida]|uniref:hypothetical protein n=1 Tax=Pasteurella multocida TaxID=747 RepID=UPI0029300453|nr:hypothetical protein [Pasteurella multocida]
MKVSLYKTPIPLITYCLVCNEKELRQAEKLLNLEKSDFLPHGTEACVDKFTNKSCVVHLDITSNTDNNNFYALLAHEAVHIYQDMIKEMREDEPSPEFEAYSIQNIFLNLLNEFQKRQ